MGADNRPGRSGGTRPSSLFPVLALVASLAVPNSATAAPPQAFEENRGQAGAAAAFLSRGDGYALLLDAGGVDLVLPSAARGGEPNLTRLVFPGARSSPALIGVDALPGTVGYLAGSDPRHWVTGIPTFAAVRYLDLYPGVDLTVSGDHRRLTFEFALSPEADAEAIGLEVGRPARSDPERQPGTPEFVVRGAAPAPDGSETGPGAADLPGAARRLRFTLERAFENPGATSAEEVARIAVDRDGNTYVAGRALAAGIGSAEAFVARIDHGKATPRYTLYFGGAAEDIPLGLAVDGNLQAIVAGRTGSDDFPLARPLEPGRSGPADGFLMKISADGSSLVYSTYLGGEGDDEARAVSIDATGVTWVAGRRGGPNSDAFIAALPSDGGRLLHDITLGGSGDDSANALQVDAAGRVWVAGSTRSPDLPGAPLEALTPWPGREGAGAPSGADAYVAALIPGARVPFFAARLGGPGDDAATSLAVSPAGSVYVSGRTEGGTGSGFVAVVPAGGEGAVSTTSFGPAAGGAVSGIACGADGDAWVTGSVSRSAPSGSPGEEAIVARVGSTGEILGGVHRLDVLGTSGGAGIALDPDDHPIIVGLRRSVLDAAGDGHVPPAARFVEAAPSGGLIVAVPLPEGPVAPDSAGCPGTIRFDNGAGNGLWQDATNWDLDQLPASGDDVCIPAGMSVTLGSGAQAINTLFVESGGSLSITVGSLSIAASSQIDGDFGLAGGTLTGGGELTVHGAFTWSSGIMTGAGTTNASAGIAFSGTSVKDLTSSRILNTAGITTWTGTGSIRVGTGASIHNSGTWDAQSNASMTNLAGGTTLFDNQNGATFRKSSGTGVTTLAIPFDNAGAVEILAGTVSLTSGGTATGAFTGSAGTTLRFGGGTYTLDLPSIVTVPTVSTTTGALVVNGTYAPTSATTLGGGTATFNPAAAVGGLGSALSISGGILTLDSGEAINLTTLSLSSGTLQGSDTVTVSGTTTWTGGTMTGAGTTNANGGVAYGGTSVKDLTSSRVLNTAGTTTWTGTGSLRVGGGASIHNSGTWEVQNDASMLTLATAPAPFDNQPGAFFRKSAGSGTTTIGIAFDNAGTVAIETGTLNLSANGHHTGSFSGSGGATLRFGGGTQALAGGSIVNVPTVSVTGATLTVDGTYTATAATNVSSGTMTFDPAATVNGLGEAVSVSVGTLSLGSGEAIDLTTLSLSSGSLRGTDTVTVSGTTTWTGGSITGAGTTNANGGIAVGGAGVKDLTASRVLNTAGNTTWTGTGALRIGTGASIHNSGTWDAQSDAAISLLAAGPALFDNQIGATFRKSAGSGTTTIDIPFDNAHMLEILVGTVSLSAGGTASGTLTGSPGTTLRFDGGAYTLENGSSLAVPNVSIVGGSLSVNGTYAADAATAIVGGTATFNSEATVGSIGTALTLTGGTLTLDSGEAIGVGTLSLSTGTLQGTDTLTVSGTTTWTSGEMTGAGVINADGGLAISGNAVKDLTSSRVLNTAGTTTWTGTGPVRIGSGASVHNAGLWDAQSDASISNLLGGTSLFENKAGAIFRKSLGNIMTTIDVPFDSAGTLEILSGSVNLSGGGTGTGSFVGSPSTVLRFGGGTYTLEGVSTLNVSNVELTSGTLDASGAFAASTSTSVSNGTMTFRPQAIVTSLGGSVSIATGTLDLGSGETIDIATLSLSSSGVLQGPDTVTVSGTTTWTGGTMTGAGTVNANGGIAISGTGAKDLTGARVLNTAGTTTWVESGPVRIGSNASIHNAGVWSAQGDAPISMILTGPSLFENQAGATFQKAAGSGTTTINVPFTNAGSVRAQAATLSFSAGYAQTAGSTIVEGGTLASSTALDIQGGSLAGSGTVAANIASSGHLAPGLSPGSLTISGAYGQSAAGSFDVEIGGLVPGTQHDRAVLSGAATLAGTLNVSLADGFVPADLDTFTVMTFPASSGTFGTVSLPALGGDLVWKVHYNPASIVLEVLADLDGDGVRNLSDCAPLDPTAWSLPAEAAGVAFAVDQQTLSWSSLASQAGPALTYDVMRGLLSQLPVGGGGAETCIAPDTGATQTIDSSNPAPGTGFHYLVRGANVCGTGTYGSTSAGIPRLTAACP